MSIYRVTGAHAFRGHQPGDVFEAVLEPDEEDRALRRGNIETVERTTPGLKPGSWCLPTNTEGRT